MQARRRHDRAVANASEVGLRVAAADRVLPLSSAGVVPSLAATRSLTVADHFRLPYTLRDGRPERRFEQLDAGNGIALLWPRASMLGGAPVAARLPLGAGEPIPVFARFIGDVNAESLLLEHGGSWSPSQAITDDRGRRLGSIWREPGGGVMLPFDPDEVCFNYRSERYLELVLHAGRVRRQRGAAGAYYRVRGLLPRATQIWLRRHYSRIQARTPFPRWPVETALHDFLDAFTTLLAPLSDGGLPTLAPWPDGRRWALVLTHDVETAAGVAAIEPVLELERELGFRSCWNFVPERYKLDEHLIADIRAEGFEVGVHGLRHDGRDLQSPTELDRRLPGIRAAASRWEATGFRAPSMHRDWELMPRLCFDYDSSYPDTDVFEPHPGGCCTWLPFFNQGLVELPLTLPQDHTLFVILGRHDGSAWIEKASFLRDRGGLAQVLTHPDYLLSPRILDAYRQLLEHFAADETAWRALPRDVSAWWRRRAASTIEASERGWEVRGPAADEATVELVE
jgi:hypothetical protein